MSHAEELKKVAAYLAVGFAFFGAMAVDDMAHGRKVQKRDWHMLVYWPLILPVILVLGTLELSRITSSDRDMTEDR